MQSNIDRLDVCFSIETAPIRAAFSAYCYWL